MDATRSSQPDAAGHEADDAVDRPPSGAATAYRGFACTSVARIDHLAVADSDGKTVREMYVVRWSGPAHPHPSLTATDGVTAMPAHGSPHPDRPDFHMVTGRGRAIDGEAMREFAVLLTYERDDGPLSTGWVERPPAAAAPSDVN